MVDEQCQERIYGDRGQSWQCQKKAVIKQDGKFYCKVHSPEYIKEKKRKWQENFDREHAESEKKWHRQEVIRKVCEPFTTEWLEANSTVLKASKDMYEALKEIWVTTVPKSHHGYIKVINDLCNAVLAKAEGE